MTDVPLPCPIALELDSPLPRERTQGEIKYSTHVLTKFVLDVVQELNRFVRRLDIDLLVPPGHMPALRHRLSRRRCIGTGGPAGKIRTIGELVDHLDVRLGRRGPFLKFGP